MTNDENATQSVSNKFVMSNTVYLRMKFVVQILLPAISTLYFTLGTIWGLPMVEQVIGTLAALATFFGVLLGLSTKAYNSSEAKFDGQIVITETVGGSKLYSLELKGSPSGLDDKNSVLFKVGTPP